MLIYVLAALVIIAMIFDIKERRIPNWLIVIGLVFALSFHIYTDGLAGFLFCLKGFAAGIVLMFLPFAMGGMGAGDVKLLGMIGAIMGSVFAFNVFLWTALFGGVVAIILLLFKNRLKETLNRIYRGAILARAGVAKITDINGEEQNRIYFPYGVVIGLGVLATFFKGWW
ncbi:Type IV prepilin peptidase TadV/CpaA [Candidatus Syntrophocurvum alkaliphilum]|uniref:Type IV prepilin peptidase TadV/CpaA n=2 Tax=Candidatus Syntrophocurvum alkaliphilum TaxID=2293317 RepID=A0A6I6DIZ0_9FIRM|nr:Type IV prepilin peptidase TadV/CpaA [Candidatus Syntrophocurvum alkaliphilum]